MRFATLLVALLASTLANAATDWRVQPEDSRLGFVATQQGGEFDGQFRRFDAEMQFSPDDLAHSAFDVSIDVTSIDTGSSQRDQYLPGEEWFFFDKYPQARFKTSEIRQTGDAQYEALGTLTIRDNTERITLPFTWRIDGATATMDGEVTIDRTNYGVGQGDWAAGDTIGRKVKVVVDLSLQQAGSS